jgi:hypothetical protein
MRKAIKKLPDEFVALPFETVLSDPYSVIAQRLVHPRRSICSSATAHLVTLSLVKIGRNLRATLLFGGRWVGIWLVVTFWRFSR